MNLTRSASYTALAALLVAILPAPAARAQQYALTTLVSFSGTNGSSPEAALSLGPGGTLYGTTFSGGAYDEGSVFALDPAAAQLTTLTSFHGANGVGGAYPESGVAVGGGGTLYGATSGAGASLGNLFSLNPQTKKYTDLFDFSPSSGYEPFSDVTLSGSVVYGTTVVGGADSDGTIYAYDLAAKKMTFPAVFTGGNGASPIAGLTPGSGGLFYGSTYVGGADNDGTVYQFSTNTGQASTLANFIGANGANPQGSLLLVNGTLYGTTSAGGVSGDGTLFALNATNFQLTSLLSFTGADGAAPQAGLIVGRDGRLYGTTLNGGASGDGTVFAFDPSSGQVSTLASFDGADGSLPDAGLTLGADGTLYGTTILGGANNDGTVFALAPAPEPSQWVSFGVGALGIAALRVRRRVV